MANPLLDTASDAVEGVASFFGLGGVAKNFIRNINSWARDIGLTKDVWIPSSNDVIPKIKSLVNQAHKLNNDAIDKLERILASAGFSKSDIIRDAISKTRERVQNELTKLKKRSTDIDTAADKATSQAYKVDEVSWSRASDTAKEAISGLENDLKAIEKEV